MTVPGLLCLLALFWRRPGLRHAARARANCQAVPKRIVGWFKIVGFAGFIKIVEMAHAVNLQTVVQSENFLSIENASSAVVLGLAFAFFCPRNLYEQDSSVYYASKNPLLRFLYLLLATRPVARTAISIATASLGCRLCSALAFCCPLEGQSVPGTQQAHPAPN